MDELHANGRAEAANAPDDWSTLISEMQRTYPGYITAFRKLEAIAPLEDRPTLKVATAHELAAMEFLDREVAGISESRDPLERFLQTGDHRAR